MEFSLPPPPPPSPIIILNQFSISSWWGLASKIWCSVDIPLVKKPLEVVEQKRSYKNNCLIMDGIEGNFGEIFSSPFFFLRIFLFLCDTWFVHYKKSAWYQDLIYTWVRYPFSNPRTLKNFFFLFLFFKILWGIRHKGWNPFLLPLVKNEWKLGITISFPFGGY